MNVRSTAAALAACLGGALGVAAVGPVTAAAPAAPVAQPSSSPVAALSSYTCTHAREPLARAVAVTAVMRPVSGTHRLALRFELLKALHRYGHPRLVRGPNLGTWLSPSDPRLGQQPADVWQVSHPVAGLAAPAYYRLRVSFRWLGTGNRVLSEQTLTTPACHQVELRPDLTVRSITASPATSSTGSYGVVIANRGASGAGPFDIAFSVNGAAPGRAQVRWIAPRSDRALTFSGPACTAGQPVTVTVDPDDGIDDFDRTNNSLTVPCPAPAAAASRYTS
jgi:hypothetical protein